MNAKRISGFRSKATVQAMGADFSRFTNYGNKKMATKIADAGAITAVATAATSWLADFELYLRLGAAFVAILAGMCAALYHFEAWRQKRRERALHDFEDYANAGRRYTDPRQVTRRGDDVRHD